MINNPNPDRFPGPGGRSRFGALHSESNGQDSFHDHHNVALDLPGPELCQTSVFSGPLSAETWRRAAEAAGVRYDAVTRGRRVRIEQLILGLLRELEAASVKPESSGTARLRVAAAAAVALIGLGVGVVASMSWHHWMIQVIDDATLSKLLAAMLPITALGLHHWVWRTQEVPRDRALACVTAGLVLSGVALIFAVAWRFGVLPSLIGEGASAGAGEAFLQGDDNRWVMIPADVVGVCGSTLLIAWAEDLLRPPAERIRARLGQAKAALAALNARRQVVMNRAIRRGCRVLLKAYRKAA